MTQAIGKYFDDIDTLYAWAHNFTMITPIINAMNQTGVIARLLEGPVRLADLAHDCDLSPNRLGRIMDYLLAHELVDQSEDGQFLATDRTRMLQEISTTFRIVNYTMKAGKSLADSLRSEDETAFEMAFGEPAFDYLSNRPDEAALFGDHMGFMTRKVENFLFSQHRFEPFKTVADIGGNMGDFLLKVLEQYPGSTGILFDMPPVIELAKDRIASSSIKDRVSFQSGSFFEQVPVADLYLLKQILHDWNDEECVQILRAIRSAILPGGRLAVIDHILSETPEPSEGLSTDIAMMIWDTGRERRLSDFETLFAATGFKLDRVAKNPNGHSLIEVVPD